MSRFNSASTLGLQLHPLAADLDECFGKVAIEGILATTDGFEPPAQDALEVFG